MKESFKKAWEKTTVFVQKYQFCMILQFALLNGLLWVLMSAFYLRYIPFLQTSWCGALYSAVFAVGHLGVFAAGLWFILQLCRFAGEKTLAISAVFLGGLLTFLLFADIVIGANYPTCCLP